VALVAQLQAEQHRIQLAEVAVSQLAEPLLLDGTQILAVMEARPELVTVTMAWQEPPAKLFSITHN
jgi:hypothetical protein